MSVTRILLKNGTVLQHDENDNVRVLRNTDILIIENRIAQIGVDIPADGVGKIIDCQQKIIAPGFINAHHHLWQTQLKGRFGDGTMLNYIVEGQ
jgi:cytosine/adenosine deaminase-related metal-dependent hydrolase